MGTAMVPFTSGRLSVLAALLRQPAAFGSESVVKLGLRASIIQGWPIFPFVATHLQLHLTSCLTRFLHANQFPSASSAAGFSLENALFAEPCCREAGGFQRLWGGKYRQIEFRELSHVHRRSPSPARNLQPPGLVQPRRPIRRADRAGRRPDRGRAAAGRRRGPDRPAANRADPAVHPVRYPGGATRRPLLPALADGGFRGAARRGVGRDPAADLAPPVCGGAGLPSRVLPGGGDRGPLR